MGGFLDRAREWHRMILDKDLRSVETDDWFFWWNIKRDPRRHAKLLKCKDNVELCLKVHVNQEIIYTDGNKVTKEKEYNPFPLISLISSVKLK